MNSLLISLQKDLDIIGLKILHQYLLDHGHESHLLYLPEFGAGGDEAMAALRAFITSVNPGFCGISLMAGESHDAEGLTALLKEWFPGMPVLWGGIHPTTAPELCAPHADYLCIGEGEQTLLDFAKAIERNESVESIPNLCWLENGQLRRNALYPLVEELDTLPYPRQIPRNAYLQVAGRVHPVRPPHLRRHKRYRGAVYKIVTSRGCPHGCTYCSNQYMRKLYGKWKVRRRGIEHVMQELEEALAAGVRIEYVDFSDDCFFSCSVDYLRAFCEAYKRRIGIPFAAKGTPLYYTRERLDVAVEAGLAWANLGLQSGSDRVCAEVFERPASAKEFLRAATLIQQYPIAAFYDVIIDNPFATTEDTLATVETLMEVPKPFFVLIFSLTFYHGTPIRERALKEHPEAVADPARDYALHSPRPENVLVEIVGTLPKSAMRVLVARFRKAPDAWSTQAMLIISQLLCRFFLEPITYFRLIRTSQRGSILGTLRVIPAYLSRGVTYYISSFWFAKRQRGA